MRLRLPSKARRRLSAINGDQVKPRQSFGAHLQATKAWLATRPERRFTFVFTPKHGSWLNLVEGFFSKLARSALRHIQVVSKQELQDRLTNAIDDINRDPVVHKWTYKLDEAA
jgi:transposase